MGLAKKSVGHIGAYIKNSFLEELAFLEIAGTHGPEGSTLSDDGVIYASSDEGWRLKHNPITMKSESWVTTGGGPLAIAFDQHANLLMADAFLSSLRTSPTQTASIRANHANGYPIKYANDVNIVPDGKVYFSDASTKLGALEIGGTHVASLLDIMNMAALKPMIQKPSQPISCLKTSISLMALLRYQWTFSQLPRPEAIG